MFISVVYFRVAVNFILATVTYSHLPLVVVPVRRLLRVWDLARFRFNPITVVETPLGLPRPRIFGGRDILDMAG